MWLTGAACRTPTGAHLDWNRHRAAVPRRVPLGPVVGRSGLISGFFLELDFKVRQNFRG